MKKVALVGFSQKSNGPAYELPDDVELWTLNHAHEYDFPRIDRLFHMHYWDLIVDPNFLSDIIKEKHFDFLKSEHDFPIYMLEEYSHIPANVRYPIEQARILAGKYRKFTSSFCYMIAMAILEDHKFIGVYGFDMDSETEYEYQRAEALKWINFAEGLGITIDISPNSGLISKANLLYGYEGIPVVNRQTIEVHAVQYERERKNAEAQLHKWEGILSERLKNGSSRRKKKEAEEMVRGYDRQAFGNECAVKAMNFLLDKCDMIEIEPKLTDSQLMEMQEA